MSGDLLLTKLFVPSLRSTLVSRPRLIEQINKGLTNGCKLTLVSAPAGFGKTTLVTEWLSRYPADSGQFPRDNPLLAWLSLDKEDNDPLRFLTYLVATLQQSESQVGEAAEAMLSYPQPPPFDSIVTSMLNDLAGLAMDGFGTVRCILVLDDYHLIDARPVHDAVAFLLENMPPNLHLIIIGRSDPPLPLSRLRARNQLTEIRQANLRFNGDETVAFLNDIMGLSLSANQIETLDTRTEGWVAGLQLAALSLRDRDDIAEFVDAFGGSHRFVMDYLVEEVIQVQPDHLQKFILQTSILNRLSGPLCEAVTCEGEGQRNLEKLEESNLFLIPLDDERTWFRYHHLFSDVMSSRLQRTSPNQIPQLHLRAAKWFQHNHLFAEAIEHALSGTDYQLAAEIVESRALTVLKEGSLATLLGWLNKLPAEIVNQRPRLGIASAWVYLLIGKLQPIEEYLLTAEKKLDDLDNADDLRGEIAAIRTYSAARLGILDQAVDQAQMAFVLLDEDNFTVRCVVAFVLGGVYYMQQDFPRALDTMKEASQLGERAGNIHVAVSALSSVGDLHHRQANLTESERAYYQALRLGTGPSGNPLPITASVYSGLAALRLNQKDLTSARKYALTGLELGEKWINADSQVSCYLTLAQIEHLESKPNETREALEKAKQLAANYQLTPGLKEEIEACETELFTTPAKRADSVLLDPLTDHELKVLRLIAAGLSNREVGEELFLSTNTVKWHLKNIYEKLDVHSRVEAVTRAQEQGLL